jgi:ATP synthase protein I
MTSDADPGPASGNGAVGASGPGQNLWLRLLGLSSAAGAAALLLTGIVALVLNGWTGVLSMAFGGLLVMVFFGISLLIGHFVGRNNPSGAVGMFVATYFIKVVGFAVVLFVLGEPEWLHERWFLIGAVVSVVFWQAAEIYGFSRARLQIFNDPESHPRTERGTTDV